MDRVYTPIIERHFKEYDQMVFLAGPRQVGKTTISLAMKSYTDHLVYLNWDNHDERRIILEGPAAVVQYAHLLEASRQKPIIVFDEIHKYTNWQTFVKGFYDTYKEKFKIMVIGSAKLNIYRKGGDSMMGRYFPYRIHPLSVAECIRTNRPQKEIQSPAKLEQEKFNNLLTYGGFPQTYIKHQKEFSRRWQGLRKEQLFRMDIRDLSNIQEIARLEILVDILQEQIGDLLDYSNLANKIRVSVDTVRRWIDTLTTLYHCFSIRPWTKNITRSLIKNPKLYLWDWSVIKDSGSRSENFVASHLLKAVHMWTDLGFGDYGLHYLRDKEKNEVDFVITKDNNPWFLVEVTFSKNKSISKSLYKFQQQLSAPHAFQVIIDLPGKEIDCFSYNEPVIVSAIDFLSQLI